MCPISLTYVSGSNKEDELVQYDQIVGEELEVDSNINVNYLKLEDDPNADDAAMVSENTKGLLNGTKNYPVRTDGKRVVYLTFDDGPYSKTTSLFLDVLKEKNVLGTFYVLKKDNLDDLYRRIINRNN